MTLELCKPFDTLLKEIYNSELPINIKRYLPTTRLEDTHTSAKSGIWKNKQGLPEGDVLSPILFNSYVRDIPPPSHETTMVPYADD